MDTEKEEVTEPQQEASDSFISIKEGQANMLFYTRNVFYNPVQEFNRDLSIAVIQEYVKERQEVTAFVSASDSASSQDQPNLSVTDETMEETKIPASPDTRIKRRLSSQESVDQGITILEALAASGLRSIRYAKEIPAVKNITANDWSNAAIAAINRNVEHNGVEHLVTPSHSDAILLMHQHRHYTKQFDVVDLDPYGCPATYLDAAVQCVKDGGILMVTCTDTAILCGNASETCYARYGSMSLKTKCCHEMALRIVLQCIESHANRYGRYIVPLVSLSADFYVRLFVRLYTGPAIVKHTASKLAMVYQCSGCETISLQPMGKVKPHENGKNYKFSCATGPPVGEFCTHCGSKHKFGGPIWANSIHDVAFVEKMLESVEQNKERFTTSKRMVGVLSLIKEELPDVPLFYSLERIHNVVRLPQCGSIKFRSALLNAGYRVSESHVARNSAKTDAPAQFIWDILRLWAKEVENKKAPEKGSPGARILQKTSLNDISFTLHPKANPESREKGLCRYHQNPLPNWGPKARNTTNTLEDAEDQSKSKLFQGKRQKPEDSDGNKDLRKYPCKRFRQGKCYLGDACRYSHVDVTQD